MSGRPAMRRSERALSEGDAIDILNSEKCGVLSTTGAGGAYGVPMHHVYRDGHIYMHCATEGRKLENIESDERVCYTVIERDPVINEAKLTTRYRSVMAFGRARILAGEEAREPLIELCRELAPSMADEVTRTFNPAIPVRVIDIAVEYITGKGAPGE